MSPTTQGELRRLAITMMPALLISVIGCLVTIAGADGLGLTIGGGVAVCLIGLGGVVVVASLGSTLPIAAFAALASCVVRIGGATVTAALVGHALWANSAVIGLAFGLLAALTLDLWAWLRIARNARLVNALMTSARESARA